MAVRTTAAEVKGVIDTNLSDSVVEDFITTANIMVNNTLGDDGLSESILTQIEKWFTAHLLASSRERQAEREQVDNARVDYTGEYGMNLNMTSYGQVVKQLDTTGKMANSGSKQAGLWSIKSKY